MCCAVMGCDDTYYRPSDSSSRRLDLSWDASDRFLRLSTMNCIKGSVLAPPFSHGWAAAYHHRHAHTHTHTHTHIHTHLIWIYLSQNVLVRHSHRERERERERKVRKEKDIDIDINLVLRLQWYVTRCPPLKGGKWGTEHQLRLVDVPETCDI